MSDDYASAAALGSIAGTLHAMSIQQTMDKIAAKRDANQGVAQQVLAERAQFVQAYNELRNMALDQQVAIARLEEQVALRDVEVAKRDTRIANMKAEIFNLEGKIITLERKRKGDDKQIDRLLNAFNDYRDQLNIGTDKHDGARS